MVYSGTCCLGNKGDPHKQIACFPSGVILEPPDEVLSLGQCSLFTNKKFLGLWWLFPVNGQHPIQKAVILIGEGENKSVQRVKLYAVCSCLHFTCSRVVASELVIWSGRKAPENCLLQGCPYGTRPWGNHMEFKQCLKVGPANVYHNALQHS